MSSYTAGILAGVVISLAAVWPVYVAVVWWRSR